MAWWSTWYNAAKKAVSIVVNTVKAVVDTVKKKVSETVSKVVEKGLGEYFYSPWSWLGSTIAIPAQFHHWSRCCWCCFRLGF